MENKQYDFFGSIVASPNAVLEDFVAKGYTADNSYIQDFSVYKNDEFIRSQFKDENGKFDENALKRAYDNSFILYNKLANTSYNDLVESLISYGASDIYAPKEQRRKGPQFQEFKMANPYRQIYGLTTVGKIEDPTMSMDEIALTNKVLKNPKTAGNNLENAVWEETPNNHFWKYLWSTLVLSQYDSDGEHKDPITGEIVQHKKGDLRTNENGEYFYERLDGRSIYGRQVLNKGNILTVDGSKWNRYDIFDSDDLNQKSPVKALLMNTALVGSMFLGGGVGTWITGLTLASQLVGLAGTLGKMASGSDNSVLSSMEGFSASWDRRRAKTEYAQQHPWCWESFIDMIGDFIEIPRTQRFIFEKVPYILKGGDYMSEKAIEAKVKELTKAQSELNSTKTFLLLTNSENAKGLATKIKDLNDFGIINTMARLLVSSITKSALNLGAIFSKGYMALSIGSSMYGEAKAAGASDTDATMLTLGYMAGLYGFLNARVSQWVFPELRAEGYQTKAIAKALVGVDEELQNAMTKLTPKVAKLNHVKKLFNIGKGLVNGDYANGTRTLLATLASGVGMAVEGTGFEFLSDLSKGCYDVVKWLQGSDHRMETFGYNFETNEWNIEETAAQYGETFLSAFVGGSIANTLETYKGMKKIGKIDSKLAASLLVYMLRNGQILDFIKSLNRMALGNRNLSFRTEEVDGELVFKQGTKTDNLDLSLKRRIINQINQWDNMLNAEGAKISDDSLLDILTLKDLRYAKLQNSIMRDAYLNDYNSKIGDLLLAESEYNDLLNRAIDTDGDGVPTDRDIRRSRSIAERKALLNDADMLRANNLEKTIKDLKKEIKDFLDGKRSYDYIKDSMFEMNDIISKYITNTSFPLFVKYKYGKEYDKLSDSDKNDALEKYESWKELDGKEKLRVLSDNFYDMLVNLREVLKENGDTYRKTEDSIIKARNFIKQVSELYLEPIHTSDSEVISLGLTIEDNRITLMEGFITRNFGNSEEAKKFLNELERIGKERLELRKKLLETKELNKELLNAAIEKLKELYNKILKETEEDLHEIASIAVKENFTDVFKDLKYIPTELKNQLLLYLNNCIRNVTESGGEADDLLYSALINSRDVIDSLEESPLWKNINTFIAAINKDNPSETITIDNIFNTATNLYNLTLRDIALFKLSDILLSLLLSALDVLRMYKASIEASKKDNVDSENLYGYAVTLNEIAKKMDLFDDDHKELAEIDSDIANKLIEDININANKIEYLLKLHSINEGLKLSTHDRVAVKTKGLIYDRLQRFINMENNPLKDWDGFDKLRATINSLILSQDIVNSKITLLDKARNKTLEEERIKQEDAIFEFFNKNIDKVQDPKQLAKLIDPNIFNIYEKPDDLLDDNVTALSDNSIIWYLCSRAALKSSDFYSKFGQIITTDGDRPIAPVFMQELAVYLNYASIMNGNIFNNFYKAYLYSLREDWKKRSSDEKVKILLSLGTSVTEYDSKFDRYWYNYLPVPKYSNITLVEGIPGAGKSAGVLPQTIELLRKFHPDILKRAFVIYGDNIDNARTLLKNLGLEDGVALGINEFMKQYVTNHKKFINDEIDSESFTDDDTYGITPKLDVTPPPTNAPKFIIVDEILRLNVAEVLAIQNFASKLGIRVLGSGDFELSGVVKKFNIKLDENAGSSTLGLDVENYEFARVPKLGLSMRTNNVLKTRNINAIRSLFRDGEEATLSYYSDNTGLYGDRVITVGKEEEVSKYEWSEIFVNTVTKMVDTLPEGEKIGFICSNPKSLLAKALQNKYKSGDDCPIDYLTKSAAAGQEASYYIIDLSEEKEANISLLKDINTGISRSSKGSLLIIKEGLYNIKEQESPSKIDEPKNKTVILKYAAERKKLLLELFPEAITSEKIKPESKTETGPTGKTNKDDKLKEDDDKHKFVQDGVANGTDTANLESIADTNEYLSKLNENLSKLKGNRAVVDDHGNIYMMLFTDNTHYLGVLINDNGSFKLSDSFNSRIDGANGFLKLVKSDKDFKDRLNLEQLDKCLVAFQDILLNTKDKSKLVASIKSAIVDNLNSDFENDKFFVNFGYKRCIQSNGKSKGKSTPFSRNVNEGIRFNVSEDSEVNSKMIVAVIGTETKGAILEIPLFVLSSPYTLVQNEYFSEVNEVFEGPAKKEGYKKGEKMTPEQIRAGTKAVVEKFKDSIKYLKLIDLFKIYSIGKSDFTYIIDQVGTNTKGTLSEGQYNKWLESRSGKFTKEKGEVLRETSGFINKALDASKWTPAKDLDLLGGRLIKTRGAYQLNGKYIVNVKNGQIDVYDLSKSIRCKVSKRVYSVSNDFVDKNGNVIAKKGNSFILVSSSRDIRSDEQMWNEFINYYNDAEGAKRRVELLYVSPPKANIKKYFDNLAKVYAQSQEERASNPPARIGSLFTSYRILKALLIDGDGKLGEGAIKGERLRLKNVFGEDNGSKIIEELENLIKIEEDQGVEKVSDLLKITQKYELLGKGERSSSLSSKFNFILFHLAENLKTFGQEGIKLEERYEPDETVFNHIETCFSDGVYYNMVSDRKAAENSFNLNVIPMLHDDMYKIDGKPIKLCGIYSTSAYGGDLSNIVRTCLDCGTNIEVIKKNGKPATIFSSPDQDHYNNSIGKYLSSYKESKSNSETNPTPEINPTPENELEKSDLFEGLTITDSSLNGTSFDIVNDENFKKIFPKGINSIKLQDMEGHEIRPEDLITDSTSGKCLFKLIVNGETFECLNYPENEEKYGEIGVTRVSKKNKENNSCPDFIIQSI